MKKKRQKIVPSSAFLIVGHFKSQNAIYSNIAFEQLFNDILEAKNNIHLIKITIQLL